MRGSQSFFLLYSLVVSTEAFIHTPKTVPWRGISSSVALHLSSNTADNSKKAASLKRIPSEEEGIPIPFVDEVGRSFIECYADSIATVNGVEYTIGVPCDNAVALCYFTSDNEQSLVPLELDDPLMDEVFNVAEGIVEEEFGDELILQRTPQTLTLVGELEDEDDEDEDDEDDFDDDDDDIDGEEEVEVLLAFDYDGRQYNLVRLLDPILLVGKIDDNNSDNRLLLSVEESDIIMPTLEQVFLEQSTAEGDKNNNKKGDSSNNPNSILSLDDLLP